QTGGWSPRGLSHPRRSQLHGRDDVLIPGAPAEVAGQPRPDLLFVGIGVRREQFAHREQEPRGTEPALKGMLLVEGLLDWMQFAIRGQPLHRGQFVALGLYREQQAGPDAST